MNGGDKLAELLGADVPPVYAEQLRARLHHGGHLRVIVAGSRSVNSYDAVSLAIENAMVMWGCDLFTILTGGARGADTLGKRWAQENGQPWSSEPADWVAHGKAAGPIRNRRMATMADALVAIWDGESKGTENMILEACKRGLLVHVVKVRQ